MYSEVPYPSRLLYSIYIDRKHNTIQEIIIHNIFFIHSEMESLSWSGF
jgi:hypothetical protein